MEKDEEKLYLPKFLQEGSNDGEDSQFEHFDGKPVIPLEKFSRIKFENNKEDFYAPKIKNNVATTLDTSIRDDFFNVRYFRSMK